MEWILIPLTIYAVVMSFVAAVLANRLNAKVKELDKSDVVEVDLFKQVKESAKDVAITHENKPYEGSEDWKQKVNSIPETYSNIPYRDRIKNKM